MRLISTSISLTLFIGFCFSQPYLEWEDHQNYLTGSEPGKFIKVDSKNRIYTSNELGSLSRYTPEGDTVWTKPSYTIPQITDMLIDGNDDIICIGNTGGQWGGQWIVNKYDSLGNEIWSTYVNGPTGNYDRPNALDVDQNNDIYITGMESNNNSGSYYTVKVSASGIIEWTNSYRGPYLPKVHEGMDIAVHDSDNIYAVGMEYRNSTTTDMKLIKYNSTGDTLWTRRFSWDEEYGGQWQSLDRGLFVDLDSFGNIYVISERSGPTKFVTIKYDAQGNLLWIEQFHPDFSIVFPDSRPYDFHVDSIGNSYATGSVFYDADSLFVLKRTLDGNIDWLHIYSETHGCRGMSLQVKDSITFVGGFQYGCNGCTRYHVALKFDESGHLIWDYLIDSDISIVNGGSYDIALDSEGGVYLTGGDQNATYQYKLFDCDFNVDVSLNNNILSTSFDADSYQWIDCENNYSLIPGETTDTFIPESNGQYGLITTKGPCTDTSECILITTLNLNELVKSNPSLIKICDYTGREVEFSTNTPLLFFYSDGTVRRRFIFE